ncbi:putative membrane protein YeaQ/YmgE (transglycosylase-associated protein family) [Ereboglobus sp. PH5-5]|uniref:GlsB/YeaQ/YmgE family stress response membrane protein n=1 Tax=unclassified Ereboglobus TaxID=2626932 RepID=UPI0024061B4B|nr:MULTISPECIES: GlsB/YeaQ/YmgE family stress response membrane protein [unclassified Ereboglobus]MDF9827184.1 putative membrane protein YeaQ/YmgE (transglycosylase-associated protein family) [Ereboglobus sp. PH5-10]MDF9832605.1 putative membrane protein YeaQ/YmgE (transglycosylase-associated protein family) [Ereboglobus sp. PH5-5]
MDTTSLIIFIMVGAFVGWLAGVIIRGFGFGIIGNIIVGVAGAFIGTWLFASVLKIQNIVSPLVDLVIYAMVGAIILLVVLGIFRKIIK